MQDLVVVQSRPIAWAKVVLIAAGAVSLALLLAFLFAALSGPLIFDDAYMFYRYATNIQRGLGIVWNPDGVPTYGVTSHGWLFVVLLFAWLPLPADTTLQLASWLTGAFGLSFMCYGLARRSVSEWALALAAIAPAVLLISPHFGFHLTTGMDTMLSFSVNVLIAYLVVDYLRLPSLRRAFVLGSIGFLAFFVRPDSGLCALGSPLLAWVLQNRPRRYGDLAGLILVPGLLISFFIGISYIYYGVPLPLGFYAKSADSYVGFQGQGSSIDYLLDFITSALPFVLIACLTGMRRVYLLTFFVPAVATIGYLLTVNQVMGWHGRFYIPLLPYIIIPSLLSLDKFLATGQKLELWRAAFMCVMATGFAFTLLVRSQIVDWHLNASLPEPVSVPVMPIAADEPLPEVDWFTSISRVSEDVASGVPPGTVIAASEVGYLGLSAPQAEIIDLVGLNDTEIGMRGITVDRLIEREPDLIWLPHTHYTGIRAELLSSRRFHEQYEVISAAYNFGLAIRRESPARAKITDLVRDSWTSMYPGTRLEDHVVDVDRFSEIL